MIVLDTHIWRWWVAGDANLKSWQRARIEAERPAGIGVSVISCWEMAKAVETKSLELSMPVGEWIEAALGDADLRLLPLTPAICVASTQLPPPIHKDPGDQLIIATARNLAVPLLTSDAQILRYPHVELVREQV